MGAVGRVFVGVELSADTRHALAARLNAVVEDTLPGRVVPPANWHITLRFLGEVGEVDYDRLLAELSTAALGRPFAIVFDGLGAFPRRRRASVLWAGVSTGEEALNRLADHSWSAIDAVGFSPEDRPFHPHLTLSRLRPPEDVRRLISQVAPLRVSSLVDAVTVFRSHLGPGGASYEVLDRIELADN
ncbi:MAG: RNA 2',3'-cyclic phosphodiesterase [Acidimicrobiia bacterium]|nr:RNA 2',3'-cyclic phosphodiesterase [Acidimicrobiia bacterium]